MPLGQATHVREGTGATVISYGRTLSLCVQAADQLTAETGKGTGTWFRLRDLCSFHNDTVAAGVRQ